MKKKNITITGDLGSGKSSVAKRLCEILGYNYFSTGNIQREMAKKKGLNTLELNYHAEDNEAIDKYIDDHLVKINEEDKLYVLDSRLAWHFVKDSFKIYLTVEPIVAAERVLGDNQRHSEPAHEDVKEKASSLIERRRAEDKRFRQKYGVDCADMNNYDLVIDTSRLSLEEVTSLIVNLFNRFLKGETFEKFWGSPLNSDT